jgi:quinol monooxygenase YgiN
MSEEVGGHVVLVKFRAKAEQGQDFAKLMLSMVAPTRAEAGNRQFEFYVDQADPANFMLYEEFVDEAAHKRHQARAEMSAVRTAIEPKLEHPPDPSMWKLALTNGRRPGEATHVTLVRFRMKPDGVAPMLEAVGGDLNHMQGNIRFDLNRSLKDPLEAMICARWASRAIWEAHNAKPEFKAFAARTASFLEAPMQRMLWKPAMA